MVDETGRQHVAEEREATRDDPSPEVFERTLQTREMKRAAIMAEEKLRCEAGNAKLCRTLGAASFGIRLHRTSTFEPSTRGDHRGQSLRGWARRGST